MAAPTSKHASAALSTSRVRHIKEHRSIIYQRPRVSRGIFIHSVFGIAMRDSKHAVDKIIIIKLYENNRKLHNFELTN